MSREYSEKIPLQGSTIAQFQSRAVKLLLPLDGNWRILPRSVFRLQSRKRVRMIIMTGNLTFHLWGKNVRFLAHWLSLLLCL